MEAPEEQQTPFSAVQAQTSKLQRVRYNIYATSIHTRTQCAFAVRILVSDLLTYLLRLACSNTKRSSTSRRPSSSTAGSALVSPCSSFSCVCSLRKAGILVSPLSRDTTPVCAVQHPAYTYMQQSPTPSASTSSTCSSPSCSPNSTPPTMRSTTTWKTAR